MLVADKIFFNPQSSILHKWYDTFVDLRNTYQYFAH